MSFKQHILKIMSTISWLAIIVPLIVACGSPAAIVAQLSSQNITICHATGGTNPPYETLSLKLPDLVNHVAHKNDIIPAPRGGCPSAVQVGANNGQVAICHFTGDTTKPYSRIVVDINGLLGHINHQGDIITAPSDGCPLALPTAIATGTGTPTAATTLTPTGTPTVAATGTSTATPTPLPGLTATLTVTPEGTANSTEAGKITICHATGSKKNPYVMITISVNGLNGHRNHARDIIPAPAGGCPK
jgi:hypothetical protein